MKIAIALAIIALAASAAALTPLHDNTLVRFDVDEKFAYGGKHVDTVWTHKRRALKFDRLSLIFAVRQKNMDILQTVFDAVSDPQNERYGQHLSLEQLRELTRDEEAVTAVRSWLEKNGVDDIDETLNGEFIVASMNVDVAENLLGRDVAEFHVYESAVTGQAVIRTRSYAVPAMIAEAVDHIFRCTDLPSRINPGPITMSADLPRAGAAGDVTPSTLWNYYGIPTTAPTPAQGNLQAVFEALGQNFSPTDLANYQSKYKVKSNPISKVIGPNSPFTCVLNPNSCGEGSLDVQVITGVGQGIPTNWHAVSGEGSIFLDWILSLANSTAPPLVNSVSYGGDEAANQKTVALRFDQELMKLGTRGVSVLIASGDDGAPGAGARSNPSACGFNPSYPATSAYATAVGATMGIASGAAETPCLSQKGGLISTGGGFSGYFATPSYQATDVQAYLNSGVKLIPGFNRTGRAYPDVAAAGHNYIIEINGQSEVGSGTSASTPAFAGMISLINNARLAAGKPALGFLNKALYQVDDSVWHKMTTGENNCAASSDPSSADCCTQGFFATASARWNPLVGLGSPKYQALHDALVKL